MPEELQDARHLIDSLWPPKGHSSTVGHLALQVWERLPREAALQVLEVYKPKGLLTAAA